MKDIAAIFDKTNIISPSMVEGMLEQGKPFIEKLLKELSEYMGDGEKVIIMTKANKDAEIIIAVLDVKKTFLLKSGDEGLAFMADPSSIVKRLSVTRMVADTLKGGIKSLMEKFL